MDDPCLSVEEVSVGILQVRMAQMEIGLREENLRKGNKWNAHNLLINQTC
jgi:hypothetical protein